MMSNISLRANQLHFTGSTAAHFSLIWKTHFFLISYLLFPLLPPKPKILGSYTQILQAPRQNPARQTFFCTQAKEKLLTISHHSTSKAPLHHGRSCNSFLKRSSITSNIHDRLHFQPSRNRLDLDNWLSLPNWAAAARHAGKSTAQPKQNID